MEVIRENMHRRDSKWPMPKRFCSDTCVNVRIGYNGSGLLPLPSRFKQRRSIQKEKLYGNSGQKTRFFLEEVAVTKFQVKCHKSL